MAIIASHMLLYTSEPEKVRAIFRDVFNWKHVDVGQGWLIFRMPPAELGIHPAEGPTFEGGMRHQITLVCDDLAKTMADLKSKGIKVDDKTQDQGWGITTMIELPGGLELMLYQPRHPLAI